MEPFRPDYEGRNVGNVVPALLGLRPVDWMPGPVAGARAAVLLVLDGLGWDVACSPSAPRELAALEGDAITTVVPSTTPVALTTITTGLPPARHGITGYRMRVDGAVLNTIRWHCDDNRRPPDPTLVQRFPSFGGRAVPVVTKAHFRTTGFTVAHLRDGDFRGWETTSVLVEQVRTAVASGERLVYAYYPGIDEVAHAHGIESRFFAAEVAAAGRLVGELRDALPTDVALVATADHGQVQVGPDGWLGLGALDSLVDVYAGEGRFRQLFARRGAHDDLASVAREQFGAHAWVFTRDELLDGGWMGVDPSPVMRRRVGDVVLAARVGVGFVDPTNPREASLVAAHGSLTPAEMQVPLLAGRGRA